MDIISPRLASLGGVKALLYTSLVTLLIGCGGGSGSGGSGADNGEQGSEENPSFTIGGTISGLSESASLTLQNNAGDNLSISANGNFSFSTTLNELEAYTVSVVTQPSNPDQICNITNASGNLANENISNIDITCTTTQYRINGTVSGLTGTESLILQNNTGDDLTISANGNFTFATSLDHLAPYHITVSTQSITADRNCVISNPTGSLKPTSKINVVCANNPHTVGGTVSGFSGIGSLVLQNNGGDNLTITSNDSFTFPTALIKSNAYMVSIMTQPSNPNQTCNITDGNGNLASENITNINIVCTTTQYTVSGTVSGLANSGGLILYNNASDGLKISSNGNFNFATPLDHLSNYNITVSNQPTYADQTCVIDNPTGKLTLTSNINITCTSNTHTLGGTVSGFNEIGNLVLQNNAGDNLTITANGSFNFPTTLIKAEIYAVSVLTQPSNPNQVCNVTNANGNLGNEDVTNINITCVAQQYTVGGTVTDLTGTNLVLQNNAGDNLTIDISGAFTFATPIDDLSAYSVTILTPPNTPTQPCRISNNQGTITGANITEISVTCSPDFYVSIDDVHATDNGTGTKEEPFLTIKAAIDFASTLPGKMNIKIAKGNYSADSASSKIVMVENISIYGGYSPVDWSLRDPSLYPSILTYTSNEDADHTIFVGAGITAATIIDGLTINSPDNLLSYAIYIDNSSPTISGNIINGYGGGNNTYVVYINVGSPIISGNTINGGAGQNFSYGIYNIAGSPNIFDNIIFGGTAGDGSTAIHNNSGAPIIYENTINGGAGIYKSRGIVNEGAASAVIYNNHIDAGTSGSFSYGIKNFSGVTATIYNNTINGGTSSGASFGISNVAAVANIYNNTISGGSGTIHARAIELTYGSTATINNNLLFTVGGGTRECLREDSQPNIITTLNNNNFFDCPSAFYQDYNPDESLLTIADLETKVSNTGNFASGNTNLNPNFVNQAENDWHLSNTTPCAISKGGQDGTALSWLFNDDNEGAPRTGNGTINWSMGAYEHNATCL
ncbi:MAG: hypothetical protein JKY50_19495 [Oleispira sp.]|nr:hypothetical protein [Oleispira sp.]MBL4880602.1 hypothetical protein [Oleispira sp.]